MRTLVLDPQPAELGELLERRRRLGLATSTTRYGRAPTTCPQPLIHTTATWTIRWRGHSGPRALGPYAETAGLVGTGPFNLGTPDDYRVPDRGYHRQLPSEVFVSTAAVVAEVVSPGDET
ncbi:MAG: hypothetical protein ACYDH5_17455 [Acidimicrobiales bacterium]